MKADETVLKARNLQWQADRKPILRDVSLDLHSGEIVGIIGPNGAGKSSLLRALARVREPDQGSLEMHGTPYARISARDFARRLGYLEQNAQVHWPLQVSRVVELGRLPLQGYFSSLSAADHTAIDEAVATTGITHLLRRVVTSLSEGEKMLVALTRLLAARPALILADEPVAALDPYHQLMIMETLHQLPHRQPGFSAIIVLHDLGLAARFCQRLLLMHAGTIAATGSPRQVLTRENLRRYYQIEAHVQFTEAGASVIPLHRLRR